MNQANLEQMLNAEEERLRKLESKKIELDNKIRTAKSNIDKYKLLLNNFRFNELSNALDTKGINVQDVIKAAQNGDLSELLKKLAGEQ